ncbi:alpha/beta-hydrolase, partial [Aureobasidium pullulans]
KEGEQEDKRKGVTGAGRVHSLRSSCYGGRNDGLFAGTYTDAPAYSKVNSKSYSQSQFRNFATIAGSQFTFNPVIDDIFVQNKPLRLFQTGHFVNVPMTVGDGTDNGTLFAANAGSPVEVSDSIQANISSLTEVTVICPGLTISSTVGASNQVWNYRSDQSSLALRLAGYGVLHAFDTGIIFGPNAGPMAGLLGIVENGFVFSSLAGGNANVVPIMMNYAISFVRTQNPSTYKSVFAPNWQTYNKNEGKQRIVVRNSGVTYEDVSAAQQTRCAFWTDIIANSFAE